MAGGAGDAPSQGMDRMAQLTARERDIVFYAIVSLKEALNVDMDKLSELLNNSNVRSTGNGLRMVMKKINPHYSELKARGTYAGAKPSITLSSNATHARISTANNDNEDDDSPFGCSPHALHATPVTPKRKHPVDDDWESPPPSNLHRLSITSPYPSKMSASGHAQNGSSGKKARTANKGATKGSTLTRHASPTPRGRKVDRDTKPVLEIPVFRKKPGPVAKASIGNMTLVECLYGTRAEKNTTAIEAKSELSGSVDGKDDDDNDEYV